jgi:hypothetical protein
MDIEKKLIELQQVVVFFWQECFFWLSVFSLSTDMVKKNSNDSSIIDL